jgi:hypothetical protein
VSQLAKSKIGQQVKPYKKGGAVTGFKKSGNDLDMVPGPQKEGGKSAVKGAKFDKAKELKKGGKC